MKKMEGVREGGSCYFCDGNDNGYADNDSATVMMMAMIDYHLLLESNEMIAAILYFLFIFNENARKNLLATKVLGGRRGKVG
jgi:hypothetical protein